MALFELVIGEPEAAAGEHLLAVPVILEGPRLTPQLVDHVPVIDKMPVLAAQAGHRVHPLLGVVKVEMVGKKLHLQRLPDQAACHGIGVVADPDGAGATDAYLKARTAFQAPFRQVAQYALLLLEPLPATAVEPGEELV